MAGVEVAGLVIGVMSAVPLCYQAVRNLKNTVSAFKHADNDIAERAVRVDILLLKTCKQLEVLQDIWDQLDPEVQNLQSDVLPILVGKLSKANTKLDTLKKKGNPARRATFALDRRYLDECIRDVSDWQDLFDPGWYLALRQYSNKDISSADKLVQEVEGAMDFLAAIKPEALRETTVFLAPGGVDLANATDIAYSMVKLAERPGNSSKRFLIDSRPCDPSARSADLKELNRDVRELATKLSYVPISVAILKCKGVIKVKNGDEAKTKCYDFVFEIPDDLIEPQSLRSFMRSDENHTLTDRMSMALQLARSISYVHSVGFVHKNVRPETVISFKNREKNFGTVILTGFEKFRNAEGRTQLAGDSDWHKNLYRHPHRQGENIEEGYVMHHDIYSLGVCLLEIGIWRSFVEYDENNLPHPSSGLELPPNTHALSNPMTMKKHLVDLAKAKLPKIMGVRYADVVVNCLTCGDDENADFVDLKQRDSDDDSDDEIAIGVKYIEKILMTLNGIRV